MNLLKIIFHYLIKIIKWIWLFVSYIPTFFVRSLIIILIILIMINYFSKFTEDIKDGTALLINMDGILVEQAEDRGSFERLIQNNAQKELEISSIIDSIHKAELDKKIKGIVIDLTNFIGGYPADIFYLSETLLEFKEKSKKNIIAIADYYSQSSYIIASVADEIITHRTGGVSISGWSSKRIFIKDLLDKANIQVIQFSKGKYKSVTEIFTRDSMSDESKEANEELQNSIWKFTSNFIEKNRGLQSGKVDYYLQNIDILAKGTNYDFAEMALSYGFTDSIKTRIETEKYLFDKFPGVNKEWQYINYLDFIKNKPKNNKKVIGVISVAGTIMDGNQPRGSAGGENISLTIKRASKDENLKALVLRVNTPGGSAFASELIREQLIEIKNLNIPIIVSMGGVAASGGYWISAESDFIFAHETTVTGSIGVAALLFDAQEAIKSIGLNEDGIQNSPFSGGMNNGVVLTSPSEKVINVIQGSIDKLYDDFIKIVSDGRNLSYEEVDQIAQGKVWSGIEALEIGLIDKIGSFNDAIDKAKELAGLENFQIRTYDQKKNLFPFINDLFQKINIQYENNYTKNIFFDFKNELIGSFKWANNFNDPKNLYFICEECIAKH